MTGFTWLDAKLAARMLVKHPALSIIGGVAIAFAVAVGAVVFELLTQALHPVLPLPDGQQVVGLRQWDSEAQRVERQVGHDYLLWREALQTVQSIAAFRNSDRNLATAGGDSAPVAFAEMAASGFEVAGVPALLGRTLTPADEAPGAAAVVVLGHAVWRDRFAADPAIVGRQVRIGSTPHTVVGVMPDGFAFPLSHSAWLPLRLQPHAHGWREGPQLQVVGRLAAGTSLQAAQAEIAALGTQLSSRHPQTHARLQPEVLPFAESVFPIRIELSALAMVWSFNLAPLLFALLVFANVAMLMFARAAMREGELLVRNALGASRGRIVAQLFVEALVLGALAAAVGLLAADFALGQVVALLEAQMENPLPFWIGGGLSLRTLLYALALTLLGATVAGVLPALKVTGRSLQARLQQRSAGAGGLRFGGVWTLVIVAQVAVTVAFPLMVYLAWRDAARIRAQEAGMASAEFLTVRVEMDRFDAVGALADLRAVQAARARLEEALEAEPGVIGASYATQLPRMYHPWRRIELDDAQAATADAPRPDGHADGWRVSGSAVAPDYFATLGVPVLAGRGFGASDVAGADGEPAAVVLVNESFVARVLEGRNPIGRRLRYLAADEPSQHSRDSVAPWYEIVGVVPDLGMQEGTDAGADAGFYHPLAPLSSTLTDSVGAASAYLAVRVLGDPAAFAPRLQAVAARVAPELRLYRLQTMDQIPQAALGAAWFWLRLLLVVSAIALLLSLAGIYAVAAFTVTRRTREIGVRLALGASRRRLLAAVLARPLRQVLVGLLAGCVLGSVLMLGIEGGLARASAGGALAFAGYAVVMLAVCLLACAVPTRRALRIQPTEALREDG